MYKAVDCGGHKKPTPYYSVLPYLKAKQEKAKEDKSTKELDKSNEKATRDISRIAGKRFAES